MKPSSGNDRESSWLIYLKGMAMGVSDLVPGVSGGTMALIVGVYRRLITALDRLDRRLVGDGFRWLINPFDRSRWDRLRRSAGRAKLPFLGTLLAGIGSALAVGVFVLPPLIRNHTAEVMALFTGLILVSAWIPLRQGHDLQGTWSRGMTAWLLLGLVLGVGVAYVPDAGTMTHRWTEVEANGRSLDRLLDDHPRALDAESVLDHPENRDLPDPLTERTVVHLPSVPLWIVFLMGTVSVSALILPGISGAYILLLLGGYTYLLESGRMLLVRLSSGDLPGHPFWVIVLYLLGALVGVKILCRGLRWCLNRHPGATFSGLSGFMLGALVAVWPYETGNGPGWPGWDTVTAEVLPWFFLAVVVTGLFIGIWERRRQTSGQSVW